MSSGELHVDLLLAKRDFETWVEVLEQRPRPDRELIAELALAIGAMQAAYETVMERFGASVHTTRQSHQESVEREAEA